MKHIEIISLNKADYSFVANRNIGINDEHK